MRVDFYLLNDPNPSQIDLVACRLIEKAYQRGHRIFVYCANANDAAAMDELLWTYKDDSFIPHNLQGEGPTPPPPVQIGHEGTPQGFHDLLVNLAPIIPAFYTNFKRIIEIVGGDEETKTVRREHYRLYRREGCELHTHDIT